jgi:OmpA-OmpF porin, OOP family
MKAFCVALCTLLCVTVLAGCRKESEAPVAAVPATEPAPSAPALETSNSTAQPTATENIAAATPADFDVNSVPITTASLPPFPFFKDPEGQPNLYDAGDSNIPFERHYFMAGNKPRAEEGKLFIAKYAISSSYNGARQYTPLEFHRNYENAVAALGGKKISTSQFTYEAVDANGGRETIEKYMRGAAPPVPDYEHHSYLIRTNDKEYWINVSTGVFPVHGFVAVLEKQAMQSSIAFLDATAMKKALDQDGRVALYINFDIDKATIRPDAQPVIDEINKLMSNSADLKLSIEGHTDSTGNADHNRTLSNNRARSVLGALVGLGIDPARLSSKGFGPDKPLADNGTEDGRAKNRRVELVKVQ